MSFIFLPFTICVPSSVLNTVFPTHLLLSSVFSALHLISFHCAFYSFIFVFTLCHLSLIPDIQYFVSMFFQFSLVPLISYNFLLSSLLSLLLTSMLHISPLHALPVDTHLLSSHLAFFYFLLFLALFPLYSPFLYYPQHYPYVLYLSSILSFLTPSLIAYYRFHFFLSFVTFFIFPHIDITFLLSIFSHFFPALLTSHNSYTDMHFLCSFFIPCVFASSHLSSVHPFIFYIHSFLNLSFHSRRHIFCFLLYLSSLQPLLLFLSLLLLRRQSCQL